ncbi:hypothetical protein ACGFJT_44295 [Actinomadura geliboluensis]
MTEALITGNDQPLGDALALCAAAKQQAADLAHFHRLFAGVEEIGEADP